MIKTIIFKAGNGYFFSLLPCPIKELCNCYTLEFGLAVKQDKVIVLVQEGELTLAHVIERFKAKIISALSNKLALPSDISFSKVRSVAHRQFESDIDKQIWREEDDWSYKYELIGTRGVVSSWIGTRDENIYIEVFGEGIPKEDDTPLAVIQIDFETGLEWLRTAFAWLEHMNYVDGFTNALLYREKKLVEQALGIKVDQPSWDSMLLQRHIAGD